MAEAPITEIESKSHLVPFGVWTSRHVSHHLTNVRGPMNTGLSSSAGRFFPHRAQGNRYFRAISASLVMVCGPAEEGQNAR